MSIPADAGAVDRLVGRIVGYPTAGTPEASSVTVLSGATNPGPGSVLVEKPAYSLFTYAIPLIKTAAAAQPASAQVSLILTATTSPAFASSS